jgi:hypothetical protein
MRATLRPATLADPVTTPHRYREVRPAIEDFRLVAVTLSITLLGPRRARYEYECELETVGDVPARYWCYHLPADPAELDDLRAWDAAGKLSARFLPNEAPGTRVEVRLRQPVRRGERYTYTFGYEAAIRTVIAAQGRIRTVTYADWVIFNVPCSLLQLQVEMPPGAEYLAAVPSCAEAGAGRITWRVRALRPLETVAVTLAYRLNVRRKLSERLFGRLRRR